MIEEADPGVHGSRTPAVEVYPDVEIGLFGGASDFAGAGHGYLEVRTVCGSGMPMGTVIPSGARDLLIQPGTSRRSDMTGQDPSSLRSSGRQLTVPCGMPAPVG